MRRPDISKHRLGERRSLGIYSEDLSLDTCINGARYPGDEKHGRDDTSQDECQLPLAGEGDDKRGHERRDRLDDLAGLFRDAGLDELSVGGGLHRDGTRGPLVEETYLLTKSGAKVMVADVACDVEAHVRHEGCVNVGADKAGDADVDKVKTES